MSDNVIQFPKNPNKDDLPVTHQEATSLVKEVRAEFVQEVAQVILENVAADISRFGFRFDMENRNHQKDWYFLGETIEAVLSRLSNLDHHLHEAIEDAIRFPDEPEEMEIEFIPEKPKRKRKKKSDPKEETKVD